MLKLAIFDLDGTLLDTLADIRYALNLSLKHFSLPELDEERVRSYVGDGAFHLVERALPIDKKYMADEVLSDFSVRLKGQSEYTKVFEGIDRVFALLKEKNVKIAVLSNKPDDATKMLAEKFLFPLGADIARGAGSDFPIKPDPALTNLIIEEAGAKKEEVLFIGDGEADVMTAKNAGVRCVSVLWGNRTKEFLQGYGASVFAENADELSQIIEKF